MGTNNLTSRTDGEVIPASDHNELVEALLVDLVPRNASRVATDIAGQLGTSAFRWLRAYAQEYFIGTASENLRVYSPSANQIRIDNNLGEYVLISDSLIEFYINNSKCFEIGATSTKVFTSGIQRANFTDTSLVTANQYVPYNSVSVNTKVGVGNFAIGATGGSYVTIWSRTLTGCVAGKRVLIDYTARYEEDGSDVDTRVLINASPIYAAANINVTAGAGANPFTLSHTWLYDIPTDGNYTFDFQVRNSDFVVGSYKVMEL